MQQNNKTSASRPTVHKISACKHAKPLEGYSRGITEGSIRFKRLNNH